MSERDYKSLPFTNIKAESSGRIRGGIAAVFGNVDSAGDRIMPGAFTRTIGGGAKRARFLWNHSYQHPPVASIKELREVTREELPPEVLAKAPDATGGLLVKREYYDTELSNWILAAVDSGDINEMSFAYEVVKSTPEPVDSTDPDNAREVLQLQELKLLDCSDVLWGCNPATVAAGAKNLDAVPIGVIASQLLGYAAIVKSGARNATSDQKLLDLIHETVVTLGASCMPDDGKTGNTAEIEIKAEDERPEPAEISTSLASLKLQTARLQIARLKLNI